jgi:hypothetical protein
MSEKKRKQADADDDKKAPGRPKVLPPHLDKRHQLRCSSVNFALWRAHARTLGFPNVSAWIRKVADDALPSKMRTSTRVTR